MSGKAFAARTGTVWVCCYDDREHLFLVLDGHVNVRVTRVRMMLLKGKKRRVSVPDDMPFRNYLNLSTGKFGSFSKDSLLNETSERFR